MLSAAAQAEQLKAKGNEYFKKEKLGAAIEAYTEAITLCPEVAVYWTNRALCFKKKNEWEKVRDDCFKALELDKSSFKAHRYLGGALLQLKNYPDAIRTLQKAVEVGQASGMGMDNPLVLDTERDLLRAKYESWHDHAQLRRQRQNNLRERLKRLLVEDHDRRVASARAPQGRLGTPEIRTGRWRPMGWGGGAPVMAEGGARRANGGEECGRCIDEGCSGTVCLLEEEHFEAMNSLENVFSLAESHDVPREVPDFLCCKITMDLFRDPVITPGGITYERSVILDHLARGRRFDPLTRAPLEESQLVPNLAMKEAVQSFLDNHGWAYQSVFHPSAP